MMRATKPPEFFVGAVRKFFPRPLHWYEYDDLYQQVWLLLLLGKTDEQIRKTMRRYAEFLRWAYGSGGKQTVYLAGTEFENRSTKGYRSIGFWGREVDLTRDERKREDRQRRRARPGICNQCGCRPVQDGKKRCQRCTEYDRDYQRARRKRILTGG
jgi:hypothetical protein